MIFCVWGFEWRGAGLAPKRRRGFAAGADNRIDDLEMLGIIDAWIKQQNCQTCGVPTDFDILQALDRWVRGT